MGKGARLKQQPRKAPAVTETHEPPIPINWPEGHVSSSVTSDDDDECIKVTIHGVTHYLHSTTARELVRSVERTLDEWNGTAVAGLAKLGIRHNEV